MKALSSLAKSTLDFSPFATAAEVPRWAASFYFQHIAWIVGLSLVPATQRVVSQLWVNYLPPLAAMFLEALTLLVRILLLVLIFRAAVLCDPAIVEHGNTRWRRAMRFARNQWRSMVVQLGMFLSIAVIFKVVPDLLIAPRIPPEWSRFYWAGVLALKNPTIIAFTMVWIVGTLRQMLMPQQSVRADDASRGVYDESDQA